MFSNTIPQLFWFVSFVVGLKSKSHTASRSVFVTSRKLVLSGDWIGCPEGKFLNRDVKKYIVRSFEIPLES